MIHPQNTHISPAPGTPLNGLGSSVEYLHEETDRSSTTGGTNESIFRAKTRKRKPVPTAFRIRAAFLIAVKFFHAVTNRQNSRQLAAPIPALRSSKWDCWAGNLKRSSSEKIYWRLLVILLAKFPAYISFPLGQWSRPLAGTFLLPSPPVHRFL